MTATHNPERLVREAREEAVRRAATGNWNARAILLAMADQLEAERARVADLETGLREACDHLSVMRSLNQRVTERLRALADGADESITAPASTSPG